MSKNRKKNELNSYQENAKKNYCVHNKQRRDAQECSKSLKNISSTSKENIELSLEVEIADSLQKLLSSPENCTSRLLDVTIIRPSKDCAVNRVETNTVAFDKEDIKDLLTIIEKQNVEDNRKTSKVPCKHATSANAKPKYEFKTSRNHDGSSLAAKRNLYVRSVSSHMNPANHNRNKKEVPSHLRNVEARLIEICHNHTNFEETNSSSESHIAVDKTMGDGSNAHHIYAAAQTFDSIRKKLTCQNKHRRDGEKSDTPCMCQNCGTLGVLIESQKGPVLTNAPVWSSGPQKPEQNATPKKQGHYVDLRSNKNDTNNIQHIKLRLKSLEDRVTHQEESAVTKEYFKKIMGKLITYCHTKTENAQIPNTFDAKENGVQCNMHNSKYTSKSQTVKQKHTYKPDQCFCVTPMVVENEKGDENKESQSRLLDLSKSILNMNKTLESFCKWGEEIIKPGFDLKSKIMSLLDEKLSTIATPPSTLNNQERTRIANVAKQTCKCPTFYKDRYRKERNCCIKCGLKKDVIDLGTCSTSTFTNPLTDSKENQKLRNPDTNKTKCTKSPPIKLKKSQYEPIFMKHHEKTGKNHKARLPLHIAYVSPCVKNWDNESTASIAKVKVKDNGTQISTTDPPLTIKTRLNVQDSLQGLLTE